MSTKRNKKEAPSASLAEVVPDASTSTFIEMLKSAEVKLTVDKNDLVDYAMNEVRTSLEGTIRAAYRQACRAEYDMVVEAMRWGREEKFKTILEHLSNHSKKIGIHLFVKGKKNPKFMFTLNSNWPEKMESFKSMFQDWEPATMELLQNAEYNDGRKSHLGFSSVDPLFYRGGFSYYSTEVVYVRTVLDAAQVGSTVLEAHTSFIQAEKEFRRHMKKYNAVAIEERKLRAALVGKLLGRSAEGQEVLKAFGDLVNDQTKLLKQ